MNRRTPAAILVLAATASAALAQGPLADPNQQMPNDLTHAMAASAKGSLAIRAVQGTPDGPPVGGESVEVLVFHRDQIIQQLNTTLDDHGLVVISDLPVSIGVRALVRIKHAGVLYQDAGPPMNDQNPQGAVDITVYETSDDPPPWRVVVRQLAAAPVADGIDVAETFIVRNEGAVTWLGEPAGPDGRRATVRVTLPPDAVEVEPVQGFMGWSTCSYSPPEFVIQMPMMPGEMTFRLAYKIPVRDGVCDMRIASGAPTDRCIFVVPAIGMDPSPVNAHLEGRDTVQGIETVRYEGGPVDTGEIAGLMLGSVAVPTPPTLASAPAPDPARPAKDSSKNTWMIVGGAAALIVVIGAARAVYRRRSGGVA